MTYILKKLKNVDLNTKKIKKATLEEIRSDKIYCVVILIIFELLKFMNFKWNDLKPIYCEEMIKSKAMPVFFDYYDYSNSFISVYEPAEDTFLMLDSLNLENNYIGNKMNKDIVYSTEIGCGSGLVSCCFVDNFKDVKALKHICIDINPEAVNLTKNLFKFYKLDEKAEFIQSNLFQYFIENDVKLDFVIFNPPYVTTDEEEMINAQDKKDITAAWAGGNTGSQITFYFVEQLEVFLILFKIRQL
jgi:release factor glutamine methyltransferase